MFPAKTRFEKAALTVAITPGRVIFRRVAFRVEYKRTKGDAEKIVAVLAAVLYVQC